jgi:hypothetical protein
LLNPFGGLLGAKMPSVVSKLKMVSVELPNGSVSGKSSFNGVLCNSPISCGLIQRLRVPFRFEIREMIPPQYFTDFYIKSLTLKFGILNLTFFYGNNFLGEK